MDLDLNILRSIATVTSLVVFLVLVARAWSRKRKDTFEEAAALPFLDSGVMEDPRRPGH